MRQQAEQRREQGAVYRRLREAAGYPTQRELAEAISVVPEYVNQIENGSRSGHRLRDELDRAVAWGARRGARPVYALGWTWPDRLIVVEGAVFEDRDLADAAALLTATAVVPVTPSWVREHEPVDRLGSSDPDALRVLADRIEDSYPDDVP